MLPATAPAMVTRPRQSRTRWSHSIRRYVASGAMAARRTGNAQETMARGQRASSVKISHVQTMACIHQNPAVLKRSQASNCQVM